MTNDKSFSEPLRGRLSQLPHEGDFQFRHHEEPYEQVSKRPFIYNNGNIPWSTFLEL